MTQPRAKDKGPARGPEADQFPDHGRDGDLELGRPDQEIRPPLPRAGPVHEPPAPPPVPQDWTSDEEQKLISAENMIIGGLEKLVNSICVGSLTTAANTFLAVSGANDDNTDSWTDNSRWTVVAAGALTTLTMFSKGIVDVCQGVRSLNLVKADRASRISGQEAAEQRHQQLVIQLDRIEAVVANLAGEHARLQAAQK